MLVCCCLLTLFVLPERFLAQSEASILVATPVKNAASELPAYFSSLERLSYPKHQISVVFLESDSTDGTIEAIDSYLRSETSKEFKGISYFRRPANFSLATVARHAHSVQLKRRQVLARARNELLDLADLAMIDFVLWMDVDCSDYPASLITDLLSVKKAIVAPHIVWEFNGQTYDRNSWFEVVPAEGDGEVIFEGYEETDYLQSIGERLYLDDFREISRSRFAQVPLDGVGTALLLVEATIHRDLGLRFPVDPYKRRVESEGFGLMARDAGFQAVGLPNYEVRHFNPADSWFESLTLPVAAAAGLLGVLVLAVAVRGSRIFVGKRAD